MQADKDAPSQRVVACALPTVIPDEVHLRILQDAVTRIHRVCISAYELAALHLARCFDEAYLHPAPPIPHVNGTWMKAVMQAVTRGERSAKVDQHVLETRDRFMPNLALVHRRGLNQMMTLEANRYAQVFNTNLKTHFKKRIVRLVALELKDQLQAVVDRELLVSDAKTARRRRRECLLGVALDVSSLEQVSQFHSSDEWHAYVRSLRRRLGLDLPCGKKVEAIQCALLSATVRIGKVLEANGQKCVAAWPIRRGMRPKFTTIDTGALQSLFGMKKTDADKATAKRSALRRVAKQRSLETKQNRRLIRNALHHKTLETEDRGRIRAVPNAALFASRIQRSFRRHLYAHIDRRLAFARNRFTCLLHALQSENRRRHAAASERKQVAWGDVLCIPKGHCIRSRLAKFDFAHSIATDGISVRFTLEAKGTRARIGRSLGRKRKHTGGDDAEYNAGLRPAVCGLYTLDEIKRQSRWQLQNCETIGIDPGKDNIAYATNVDSPRERSGLCAHTRYTNAQRRRETLSDVHAAFERSEVTPAMKARRDRMAEHNSKSCHLATLALYFAARRVHLEDELDHYEAHRHRQRTWKSYKLRMRSFTHFVRRLQSLHHDKNRPLVLAYGSWSNVAGRPGSVGNKGRPPCIGKKLRQDLSAHFCVVIVPEAYTSQTCHVCQGPCGPCAEIDRLRRKVKLEEAGGDEILRRRASRFETRGVRRCKQRDCATFLNRDYNAAVNIGRRLSVLLAQPEARVPNTYVRPEDALVTRLQACVEFDV